MCILFKNKTLQFCAHLPCIPRCAHAPVHAFLSQVFFSDVEARGTFPKLSPPHLPPDIVSWCGPEQPPLSAVAFILLLFSPSPKVNPPYYVPLVELVPHPETAPATMDRTYALMRKIGQSPVRVLKEIDGFVLNRLQYAVIGEAWRLVEVRVPPSFSVSPDLRPIFLLLPCVPSSILPSHPFSLSLSSSPTPL